MVRDMSVLSVQQLRPKLHTENSIESKIKDISKSPATKTPFKCLRRTTNNFHYAFYMMEIRTQPGDY